MSDDSTPDVSVRPYGYVSDDPTVYRVRDGLAVGNAASADSGAAAQFDRVLSLTTHARDATTHHRPLVDGRDNEWAAFAAAVHTARRLHERDGSLLVHCRAGVSRSSAVAAAAIAAVEDRRFVDALHRVQDAHPDAVPHPALHEQAVRFVASLPE